MADVVNNDIYNMHDALFNMQKNMMEETDEETLSLGTYGWFNAVLTKMITSNIRVAADNSNEVFPTRAKYDKNVIYHAINSEITDINATPASMEIMFCIKEESLNALFAEQGEVVIISDECKLIVGKYEYHFDYPIQISKQLLENNTIAYSAKYDITYNNSLSDITNPFLPSPYVLKLNGSNYIFIACSIRQVERAIFNKKIQTNNPIDNKTFQFEYDNQLATFYVLADNGTNKVKLNAYFEGTSIPSNELFYCWYNYIDEKTVRVKFDSNSYIPSINTTINAVILTTHGSECEFEYTDNIIAVLEDTDNYIYNSAQIIIMPQSKSSGGKDKKSIDIIKSLLPKQALSRGNIINEEDIINYFNRFESDIVKITPKKKIDNQIMRQYYLYLLLKDSEGIIVPTNTINIKFNIDQANISIEREDKSKQYFFNQGIYIGYNRSENGVICTEEESKNYEFVYTLPYKVAIDTNGPFISYYMDVVDKIYRTYYSYINNNSPIQFICSSFKLQKGITDHNYKLTLTIHQNIDSDYGLVVEEDEEVINKVKVIAVLYDEDNTPYRYFVSKLVDYKTGSEFNYTHEIDFEFDGVINEENKVRLNNGNSIGSNIDDVHNYGYMPRNCKIDIYVVADFGDGKNYGTYSISEYVKGINEYTCTNMFTTPDGISFFENFTEITTSAIDATQDGFIIKSVPVIKYNYASQDDKLMKFFNNIIEYKNYIYKALNILEDGFSIDFKFYNTYGPSYLYKINSDGSSALDKVNITLNFEMMIKKSVDDYTKNYIIRDIQEMFESFSDDNDKFIPKIISTINNKYSNSIYYLAYLGFNGFDSNYQNFFYIESDDINVVPEFICLNRLEDNSPDINIRVI